MGIYMGILMVFMIGIVSANELQVDVNQPLIIKTSCPATDATADIQIYYGTIQDPDNQYLVHTTMNGKDNSTHTFKWNGLYYVKRNTWISPEFITKVEKI
jgi:hypothetical protein